MKTYLFGLVCLGLTNLMIAQNEIASVDFTGADFKTTTTKAVKNVDYLTSVYFNDTAKQIKLLHQKAAAYDVKDSKVYSAKSSTTYTVVFKEGDNEINAVYNRNGEIVSSTETFKNIRLPYTVSHKLATNYPGWLFNQTWCYITYSNSVDSKIIYKIELKKGNKTKMIKIAQ